MLSIGMVSVDGPTTADEARQERQRLPFNFSVTEAVRELRTAQALGLTIPRSLLLRASEVIQ